MSALLVVSVVLLLAACGGSGEPDPELDARLLEAARVNRVAEARELIEQGADVNVKDETEQSAYLYATGVSIGWSSLLRRDRVCVLDDLWVEPEWIGKEIGTVLLERARDHAIELGAEQLEWEAEPNATGFYERMGGRNLRDGEPTPWGRVLQVLALDLSAADELGRQLVRRAEHDVRERERIRRRRVVRVREDEDAHPGRVGGADPVRRVLDRGASRRLDPQAARSLEVHVRRGLPAVRPPRRRR